MEKRVCTRSEVLHNRVRKAREQGTPRQFTTAFLHWFTYLYEEMLDPADALLAQICGELEAEFAELVITRGEDYDRAQYWKQEALALRAVKEQLSEALFKLYCLEGRRQERVKPKRAA